MQTTLENLGQLERRLNVAVPVAQIEGEVQKRLARLARTVKIAGFRPGKVPLKMIAQQYGPQVRSDVIADTVSSTFNDAVREQKLRVVMGSIERTGPWAVPPQIAARVLWGNLLLDLRQAQLSPGVTTIEVNITMGNVELIVTPGVTVDVEASSFLGNVEDLNELARSSSGPVVRVLGRVKLGNLAVTSRYPGETRREAHRRRRMARRWYRGRRWH